jgi:hypothetical protein
MLMLNIISGKIETTSLEFITGVPVGTSEKTVLICQE